MDFEIVESRECPSCGAAGAEPEQDGDTLYLACSQCQHEFGWARVTTANTDDHCAVGIPEHVRRRASTPAERAVAATGPVLLQIGKRPS